MIDFNYEKFIRAEEIPNRKEWYNTRAAAGLRPFSGLVPWIDETISGRWSRTGSKFYFELEEDYLLFILRWK
jgi:hypothetical protein